MSQPTTISSVESVLPAMRTFAGWISFFAFLVSVIYTILFNIGQASDAEVIQVFGYAFPYAKALLAATGALQDSTEILAFLFGFWILTLPGRKPRFLVMMATVAIILSITLVAWSIASTWGSNSAMIDQQAARGTVAREQLALIQRTIAGNEEAASDLRRNAAAIRIKAADYGSKYTSKAIEKINEAQGISAQAAELAKANLKAIEAMGQVDQDALTDINSAQAAFDRIAAATGLSPEAVGTTFLLTRASQLEAIGIISGLFVIMIPPAPRRGRGFLGRMRDGFTRGANEAADRAARSAGGFAADVAMPGAAGSRFAPALSVPDWLATQNRSHPHSDAGSGHSGTHSEGHSGNGAGNATQNRSSPHSDAARNGLSAAEQLADPNNFELLRKQVQHEKFGPAFIDIATGAIGCSQNQVKKRHGIGGELTGWLMLILEAWGIVSEPGANNTRVLIEPLSDTAAQAALDDVRKTILGG